MLYKFKDEMGLEHPYEVYGEENYSCMLDVLVFTYNHEKYIAQALDSILMQDADFSYHIIIGEDCSTDETREVVLRYYHQYPDKITLVLWEHNVGVDINSFVLYKLIKSKYVALLEGDDYWTDSLKLKKQVSFLEENGDFIGTGHNVRCVDDGGNLLHKDFRYYSMRDEHIYGIENAKRFELIAQTASLVYRNFWKEWSETQWDQYYQCRANGDIKDNVLLGLQGKAFYMRDIMADHRRIFTGDSWTATKSGKNLLWITYQFHRNIYEYIKRNYEIEMCLQNVLKAKYRASCTKFMEATTFDNFRVFVKMYKEKLKYAK